MYVMEIKNWAIGPFICADFTAPSEISSRNPPAPEIKTGKENKIEIIACAFNAFEGVTDGIIDESAIFVN